MRKPREIHAIHRHGAPCPRRLYSITPGRLVGNTWAASDTACARCCGSASASANAGTSTPPLLTPSRPETAPPNTPTPTPLQNGPDVIHSSPGILVLPVAGASL